MILRALLLLALLLLAGPAWGAEIVARRGVTLDASVRRVKTAPVALAAQTSTIEVRLRRPTALAPLAWDDTATLSVGIVLTVDGLAQRYTGQATGGIRVVGRTSQTPRGHEALEYVLTIAPTWGYFGARAGTPKRLGETALTSYTAHIELVLLRGASLTTDVVVTSTEQPAPFIPFRSSVAFDTGTSAVEDTGDGIISVSHTAGGAGSDRAVFGGSSNYGAAAGSASTSMTYGGTAMTEMYDQQTSILSNLAHAGYQLALGNTLTGAQTVTNTLAATNPTVQFIQVISMTGVDQTTPVGTAVTSGPDATSPFGATVGSVGTDDLVVDNFILYGLGAPVVGADQTVDAGNSQVDAGGTIFSRASYQLGSAGGVMSWTATGPTDSFWGGVAFKPTAGAAATTPTRTLLGVGQ